MDEDGEIDSELQFDDQGNKKAPRRHHPRMDIVSKLLSIVETQALMGENCNPGSDLNLGEKVVNRYAQVSLYFQILNRYLYVHSDLDKARRSGGISCYFSENYFSGCLLVH